MWPAWRELPRTCCGFGEANSFHAWRTGERIKRQHLAPETERSNFAEFGFFLLFQSFNFHICIDETSISRGDSA